MVPLTSEFVELSSVARNDMASQTPGGGLRSPAARALTSQAVDPALSTRSRSVSKSGTAVASSGAAAAAPPGAAPPAAAPPAGPPFAPTRWARWRRSVWAPVFLKAGAASVALSCLAFAGAAALPREPAGVEVSASGVEWISGGPEESGGGAPEPSSGTQPSPPALTAAAAADSKAPAASAPPCKQESGSPSSGSTSGASPGVTPDGRIVLNVASADELTRLPGIGQKRAEQIVALRERLGKFKRITDLLRVKGIGPKSLRRLTPLLVLDPPTEEPGS